MPRLLVNIGSISNQVVELEPGEHLVGREKDASVQLPNVSVSRRHAKVTVANGVATVEDLESGNGTSVNGKPIRSHVLVSKDELRIGKYTLVFLGDTKKDEFYKGRAVKYMPAWEPKSGDEEPAETFMLSKEALQAMAKQSHLVEDARVLVEGDDSRFWYPESRPLTFGDDAAMVHPAGWYVFGTVAEIHWDGKQHVLTKKAFWCPVKVNGSGVSTHALRHKDRFQIAGTAFRYDGG